MKYQIPKTFMGKPVEGSLERVLAGLNKNQQAPSQTSPLVNAPDLQGYIFVPSINLYVAKERTYKGLNWYQTHEELQKENLRMPTIPQFIEYLKFLQSQHQDRNEAQTILDEILKIGNWRAEWLDARFEKSGSDLLYCFNHKIANNQIISRDSQKLEPCLREDCWADIFGSANSQGLPNEKLGNSYEQGKNAYFYFPRENFVARFGAYSGRAYLNCYRDPTGTYSSLGVRGCLSAEGAQFCNGNQKINNIAELQAATPKN